MKPLHIKTNTVSRHRIDNVEHWDIDKVEIEIMAKKLPESLRLSCCEMIINLAIFISKHVEIARYNNGNRTFRSYYDRLVKVNDLLK